MPSSKTQQLKNTLVKTQTVKKALFIYSFWVIVIKNLVILPSVKG